MTAEKQRRAAATEARGDPRRVGDELGVVCPECPEHGQHRFEGRRLDGGLGVSELVIGLTIVAFVLVTLAFQESAGAVFNDLRGWLTSTFDWFFLLSANVFVLLCLFLIVSPYGKVRIGGKDATPDYSYSGWFAMLFAAGMGIGLMFFGVLEPLTHTLNPPLGIDPADTETARAVGMSTAILHWGLHAWAIYAVVGLSLAFFCFNRGMPLTLRSAFFPLVGNRVWGPFGHCIDITAVLATLFGLAVSLVFIVLVLVGLSLKIRKIAGSG